MLRAPERPGHSGSDAPAFRPPPTRRQATAAVPGGAPDLICMPLLVLQEPAIIPQRTLPTAPCAACTCSAAGPGLAPLSPRWQPVCGAPGPLCRSGCAGAGCSPCSCFLCARCCMPGAGVAHRVRLLVSRRPLPQACRVIQFARHGRVCPPFSGLKPVDPLASMVQLHGRSLPYPVPFPDRSTCGCYVHFPPCTAITREAPV